MGTPQIILIIILAISLGIHLVKHGEDKQDEYNFFIELFSSLVLVALLYWGGFFN